jgi:hypothetical protein
VPVAALVWELAEPEAVPAEVAEDWPGTGGTGTGTMGAAEV